MTWEQRWHPLREEWVVVAAHRNDRPWVGAAAPAPVAPPSNDPDCALCPGNLRVDDRRNPDYQGVYTFDNDHPCVGVHAPETLMPPPGIYRNRPARGTARVTCYHPRHDLTLAELKVPEVTALLGEWQRQYRELGNRPDVEHVLIFENKGEVVGVSNPHPHCQVYATNFVFSTIRQEAVVSQQHWQEHRRVLFQDILDAENSDGRRIVCQNDSAIAFVPYFARYAYETFVAPRATYPSIAELGTQEIQDLAQVLSEVLVRFDNLWNMSFPYVMALHQAPTDGRRHEGFHFHIEFHPPLRKPDLMKYLAGPEIGGGSFLSDTCAETKAAELQATSPIHYKQSTGSQQA